MPCPACFAMATTGVALANGEVVHAGCFQKIIDTWANAEEAVAKEQAHLAALRRNLAERDSLLGQVFGVFRKGQDRATLRATLQTGEQNLQQAERKFRAAQARATPIFDVLLDYPPDWSQRLAALAARDKVCANCKSALKLEAHHVIPYAKGGTNELGNLKLLCQRCHKGVHGGKNAAHAKAADPPAIAEQIQLLGRAIAKGEPVEFLYRKATEKAYGKQKVTPLSLVEMQQDNDHEQTLCLIGLCQARHEERPFALKQMRALKVLKKT